MAAAVSPISSTRGPKEQLIWEDERTYPVGQVLAPAPIESVEVLISESFPPQYRVRVVSGLPNACFSYGGYYLTRDDDAVRIEILNWHPSDPDVACAEVYGTVTTTIP